MMAIRRGDKRSPKRRELAQRDIMLFLFGINTGLRVSDIVRLKVSDVRGKSQLLVHEGKTKKKRLVNMFYGNKVLYLGKKMLTL
jgi:integrase